MTKFEKFKKAVKSRMGKDFVGFCDARSELRPQFGFATNEPDLGENVPGKYVDVVREESHKAGFRHVACMPFPVNGRLVYVCAGPELGEKA